MRLAVPFPIGVVSLLLALSPIVVSPATAALFRDRPNDAASSEDRAVPSALSCADDNNSDNDNGTGYTKNPASILKDGREVDLESLPARTTEEGFSVRVIDEAKKFFYISSFLSPSESETIRSFCSEPGRFKRSPQTNVGNIDGEDNRARTSASCPLLFAMFYIERFEDVKAKSPKLAEELALTWDLTKRAADLLGVDIAQMEPFQLLKYSPGEFYKQHHDHRGYYDADGGYPDRPITLLLFLNDVDKSAGGRTKFEKLGIEIIPRMGDAVAWSNVDGDGRADPDMVHEAMALAEGTKMAVNIWVRDKPFTDMRQAAMRQH